MGASQGGSAALIGSGDADQTQAIGFSTQPTAETRRLSALSFGRWGSPGSLPGCWWEGQ